MSQTATFVDGFASPALVRAYMEGAFGNSLLRTDRDESKRVEQALASDLRKELPEFPCVSFTSSGSEANEKAFALCQSLKPE